MEILNEGRLNPGISSKLSRDGILSTTDSINELNGKSAVVDLSKMLYKEDALYMQKLAATCEKVKGYTKKVIYIPVAKWFIKDPIKVDQSKTPLGSICRYIRQSPAEFKSKFSSFIFVFYSQDSRSFALYPEYYNTTQFNTVINLINNLATTPIVNKINSKDDSERKSPVKMVVDTKKLAMDSLEQKKQAMVNIIANASENSSSEEEAWDTLNNDEELKNLIAELEEEDDGHPKFNNARTARMESLNNDFMHKEVHGKTVQEIIEANDANKEELPVFDHLKVASINEEWDELRFVNFQKSYDINSDIFKMLQSLSTKSYPVSIIDINVEDTSTNMDYVDTYTVNMEDGFGKRFTLEFDIPKFRNNRFMKLRGNEKVMSGQLLLLPCLKTDEDSVQCVTNYNKIFIYRYGMNGRSYSVPDKIIKTIKKLDGTNTTIKVFPGDNRTICSKYELPSDYIDLASNFNRIETKDTIYYFNQDDYYTQFNADPTKGIPYGINKVTGNILYYVKHSEGDSPYDTILTLDIANQLCSSDEAFSRYYKSVKPANRLNYSQASILSNRIPLAVVLGYSLGFDNMMKMIVKKYRYEDIHYRSKDTDLEGIIKFKDKVAVYPMTYNSSMLLNGLSECDTESYPISEVNRRSMWLDFLDEFGGRMLADGLDNFVDLFVDPITEEVCHHCKIPSNYFEMLIYGSNLLTDNKYNKHTDITGNRYRTNEIVAGYFYKALSKSYTDYKAQVKRGRKVGMSMKRSAVIDLVMQDPMMSDLSIMNPLLEIEASNSASFKGLSGMNSDRSYGLDKRTYDDTMVNKLALSTGFAANVGINRQTTIDMDIEGNRGYIKNSNDNTEDMSITKTFSMSEAVTPFGTTRETI